MARRAWLAYARIADIGRAALMQTLRRLSLGERQRYARFGSARRKREFLAARWLCARLRSWSVSKRALASISHSGGWTACALLESGVAGVDIEPMVRRDFAKLGSWAFPPGSDEAWPDGEADLARAFYGRWTRYEAGFKTRRSGRHRALTWFVGGVALSACLPLSAVVQSGRPLRWQRRGGFARKFARPATRSSS